MFLWRHHYNTLLYCRELVSPFIEDLFHHPKIRVLSFFTSADPGFEHSQTLEMFVARLSFVNGICKCGMKDLVYLHGTCSLQQLLSTVQCLWIKMLSAVVVPVQFLLQQVSFAGVLQ